MPTKDRNTPAERGRGQKLSAAERIEKGARALSLSARGMGPEEVAADIGVNVKTATKLIYEVTQARKAEVDQEMDILIATAVEQHRQIIRTCWRRVLSSGKPLAGGGFVELLSPHGLANLLATAQASQREIDRLLGVEPPQRIELTGKLSVADAARKTANTPPERRLRLVDAGLPETGTDGS